MMFGFPSSPWQVVITTTPAGPGCSRLPSGSSILAKSPHLTRLPAVLTPAHDLIEALTILRFLVLVGLTKGRYRDDLELFGDPQNLFDLRVPLGGTTPAGPEAEVPRREDDVLPCDPHVVEAPVG